MDDEKSKFSGIPLTDEELAEYEQAFSDIEECIEGLQEEGKDK